MRRTSRLTRIRRECTSILPCRCTPTCRIRAGDNPRIAHAKSLGSRHDTLQGRAFRKACEKRRLDLPLAGEMSHAVEEKIASSSAPAGVPLPHSIRRAPQSPQRQETFSAKNTQAAGLPCLTTRCPARPSAATPWTSPTGRGSLAIINFAAAKRWPSQQSFSADRSVIESMERRLCLGRACRSRQIHDGRSPRLCDLQLLFCRGRCRTRQADTSEQAHEAVKSFRNNTLTCESVRSVTCFTL